MEDFVAVIMAGGEGQRFWPLSTRDRPKQFLDLEHCGRSLLQGTFDRLVPVTASPGRIIVVSSERYVHLVREQVPRLPRENLVLEPIGRDTAACIALAALTVRERFGDVVMGVFPADHRIGDAPAFRGTLATAARTARERGAIVTLGIEPTWPATGYGYIERGRAVGAAHDAVRFVEKPDRARAQQYLDAGRWCWNSGIFVWTVATILSELERHAPDVFVPLERAYRSGLVREVFPSLPKLSIDYAVMERSSNVLVLPARFGWDDIGDWEALARLMAPDSDDTVVGRFVGLETHGNIVYSDDADGVVIAMGVEDLVIVKRHGTLLVLRRDRIQDIKRLLADERVMAAAESARSPSERWRAVRPRPRPGSLRRARVRSA